MIDMDLLSFFNTAFVICLAMTILFFVISVVLFFLFDIKTIYMIRSGRAQARTVKEMEEINSSTGRLRPGTKSGEKNKKKKEQKAPVIQPPSQPQTDGIGYANAPVQSAYEPESESSTTERLSSGDEVQTSDLPAFDDSSQTTVLQQEAETSVLNIEAETSVLNQQMQEQSVSDYGAGVVTTFFDVVKKIVISDTEEVIR